MIIGDYLLTENDLQILNTALAEHLPELKEKGLNLYQEDQLSNQDGLTPAPITKEKVVTFLHQINQHDLAKILSEKNGKSVK